MSPRSIHSVAFLVSLVLFPGLFIPLSAAKDAHTGGGIDGDKVAAMMEALMGCYQIPGVSVSVVRGDSVLLSEGYGLADLATGRKVTRDTLFSIGSITKSFTAALLADILEDRTEYVHVLSLESCFLSITSMCEFCQKYIFKKPSAFSPFKYLCLSASLCLSCVVITLSFYL